MTVQIFLSKVEKGERNCDGFLFQISPSFQRTSRSFLSPVMDERLVCTEDEHTCSRPVPAKAAADWLVCVCMEREG